MEAKMDKNTDIVTNRDVIAFYNSKNDHYKFSDEFIKGYRQKGGAYISYANELGESTDMSQAEPNQRWHLLVSYYEINLTDGKLNLDDAARCWEMAARNNGLLCPELLLWMAESAGIDINIAMKKAITLCENGDRRNAHKAIKEAISWELITDKIIEFKQNQ